MRRRARTYTPEELMRWIPKLIEEDNLYEFYHTRAWRNLRAETLEEQHNECQMCKAEGRMTPADTVHHIKTVRQRPDLALTKSNLMAVCEECHYKIHHEPREAKWPDERW